MSSQDILIGTAGVYYLMSELSRMGFHAAATHGNAPNIDVLVCSSDGKETAAIQVKSSGWAIRTSGRGADKTITKLDFALGPKAAKINSEKVFVAFVDFANANTKKPDVYLMPSTDLFKFCESWVDKVPMVRYQPTLEQAAPYKNELGWDRLKHLRAVPPIATEADQAEQPVESPTT